MLSYELSLYSITLRTTENTTLAVSTLHSTIYTDQLAAVSRMIFKHFKPAVSAASGVYGWVVTSYHREEVKQVTVTFTINLK